ncbi:MAG TPA: glycosyltransferase family 2 protein [Myxococcota bacterium]|mgnify:CR=1 FL=1|nr:glycosyltransferase family 2 protein [Myxococcota bacterium]HOD07835.1 glycosyltransferase family 2 protein [Myxococcota bacterium]HPB50774.1 glycosyltransferase family 2 protein [Myxococcota bacterium]HQP95817.1 glycosyltransferase family 2 protein [Myxococcota bacterium]
MARPDVSIVLPVFNEVESIEPLFAEIQDVMSKSGRTWEVIACDDGSTDGSRELLLKKAGQDERLKLIVLMRNFGQTAALDAGFRAASGDIIVPMDADLQNDPADIPRLIARLEEGADLVSGWRANRRDSFLTKTLPSMIANKLVVSRVTGVRLHDYGCTLKAYRASFLKQFHLYGEMHRLIPAYVKWAGGRVTEEKVNHRARKFGRSKYNLSKTFRLILDLMTIRFLLGYSTKPLYFMGKYGLLAILLGTMSMTWTVIKKILWWENPLYTDPFFIVSIFLFIAGFQFLFSGLLAELSMRTYYESQDKPPYVIARKVNL